MIGFQCDFLPIEPSSKHDCQPLKELFSLNSPFINFSIFVDKFSDHHVFVKQLLFWITVKEVAVFPFRTESLLIPLLGLLLAIKQNFKHGLSLLESSQHFLYNLAHCFISIARKTKNDKKRSNFRTRPLHLIAQLFHQPESNFIIQPNDCSVILCIFISNTIQTSTPNWH